MKLAAIDIGSNAVRLLLAQVFINDQGVVEVNKDTLLRMPIRLGEEAFSEGRISAPKIEMLSKSMHAFKLIMDVHGVKHYRACATSAMREAKNNSQVVEQIKKETGINIEVIDGIEESELVFAAYSAQLSHDKGHAYLTIDVGGGSTETLLYYNGKIVDEYSWDIGTLRLLNNQVDDNQWKEMKKWLKKVTEPFSTVYGVGSGGNIIKIKNSYAKGDRKYIQASILPIAYKHLNSFTIAERIKQLGMKPDRADVIIPATKIYMQVCEWAKIKKIFVPQVGLSDGIINHLYKYNLGLTIKNTES